MTLKTFDRISLFLQWAGAVSLFIVFMVNIVSGQYMHAFAGLIYLLFFWILMKRGRELDNIRGVVATYMVIDEKNKQLIEMQNTIITKHKNAIERAEEQISKYKLIVETHEDIVKEKMELIDNLNGTLGEYEEKFRNQERSIADRDAMIRQLTEKPQPPVDDSSDSDSSDSSSSSGSDDSESSSAAEEPAKEPKKKRRQNRHNPYQSDSFSN